MAIITHKPTSVPSVGAQTADGPRPSSTTSREPQEPMAAELMQSSDDGEGVLEKIVSGAARDVTGKDQTREVSDESYPPAHGMRNRSGEGAKIPDKL